MIYVGFRLSQVVAAHGHKRLERAMRSKVSFWLYKSFLCTQNSVTSISSYHSLQTEQKTITEKIAFAMAISKAQGQTRKRVGPYPSSPVFPMASFIWSFSSPPHLTKSLLGTWWGIDKV
jgi:hypothetical protein